MTETEIHDLDNWIGDYFKFPYHVDEWVLSTDGGKSCWASCIRSREAAEEYLAQITRQHPDSRYVNSTAHHWQFHADHSSNPASALEVVEKIRQAGWLVIIKAIPPESAFIIEGSRSEYDAPSEDQEVGRGQVLVEGMNMRDRMDWKRRDTMADTVPLAICLFARKLFGGEK
jgi:hypothetical protein